MHRQPRSSQPTFCRPALMLGGAIVLLAAATILMAPSGAGAVEPHPRDGWFTGLSFGLGGGKFVDGQGSSSEFENGIAPQLRLGRLLGRHWAIGLEYTGWFIETGDFETKYRTSLQSTTLAATWYPGDPDTGWGGLYFKFGTGVGWGGATVVELDEEGEQVLEHRDDEGGVSTLIGAGYEFRIAPSFAAGAAMTITSLAIGGSYFEEAWFVPLTLTMNWYFGS